jgi:post-segregation antitoxin (ccd killing protein)
MDITFTLPDALVKRAKAAGLLTDKRVADLLEAELRRSEALTRFGEIIDALGESGMTEAELEAELDARKAERLKEN